MTVVVEKRETPPSRDPNVQPRAPTRRRRGLATPLAAVILISLFALASWRLLHGVKPAERAADPPQPVGVAAAATGDLDVVLNGLGAVTPLATVTVKTRISGELQNLTFTEGQTVHKGDLLARIDPRPYQVALAQTQGTLAHDQGVLEQALADNARFQLLNKQDSISRQQVEDQVYLIKQDQGTVAADQGAVDNAKLNLAYCRIVSPVEGRVGIRLVDEGNFVQTTDSSGLFVVTQLQPISVLFTLPEDDIAEVQKQMASGALVAQAYDRANTRLIATGALATIDNQIDGTTGTVKLRAMFPNTDNALFPQAFVNIRLLVRKLRGVVVAPQAAVQTGAPGEFVYLVKPDVTVAVRPIKTGVVAHGEVEVTDGLKPADRVVTDGLDRLRAGAKITPIEAPALAVRSPTHPAEAAPSQ